MPELDLFSRPELEMLPGTGVCEKLMRNLHRQIFIMSCTLEGVGSGSLEPEQEMAISRRALDMMERALMSIRDGEHLLYLDAHRKASGHHPFHTLTG